MGFETVMGIYHFFGQNSEVFHSSHESLRSDVQQFNSLLSIHNDESADIKAARLKADEIINISGANVLIYARTSNADYDTVFDEDADPTYLNPIPIKGFFRPEPLEVQLTEWGVDTTATTKVVFSLRQIYMLFGDRMLRPGDVLKLPYNGAWNVRVLNAAPTGSFRYVWLYLTCDVETLTADVTVRPEEDMIEGAEDIGVYRESL
jgi:hypothetical protein